MFYLYRGVLENFIDHIILIYGYGVKLLAKRSECVFYAFECNMYIIMYRRKTNPFDRVQFYVRLTFPRTSKSRTYTRTVLLLR